LAEYADNTIWRSKYSTLTCLQPNPGGGDGEGRTAAGEKEVEELNGFVIFFFASNLKIRSIFC
jgi:hypothetical protein